LGDRANRARHGAPALLLALWWPALGSGAEQQHNREIEQTLESVIVTATRLEQSVFDVSEAVTVLHSEDIRRHAPDVLAEMLRGTPGAFFQQTTPGQGIPVIRGLKGSQVLHLVDGMRLNNAFFRDAPNQYLGLVDAYSVERTEVIRGSAPSLYGADGMGGVVQLLSWEPTLDAAEWTASTRLYASYDSADSSLVGRAEAALGRSGNVLSAGMTLQKRGNRTVGGGDTIRPSAYRVEAADGKWRADVGEAAELMVSFQHLEQPSTPRVDEMLPGYGQDEPSSEQYFFRPNRREFLHARYRIEGRSRWFSRFEAHVARQEITDDRLTQDYGAPVTTREFNSSQLDGLTLQFNSPWGRDATPRGELVWGFEYYTDTVNSTRYRRETADSPSLPVRSRFPDGSGMDSFALYASNRWYWERFWLDAGLRYSDFDIFLPATGELGAVRLEPTDLTGDVHLGAELAPGVHAVANAGRGFRPPNIFDLGTLGPRPGNRFNVPNPNLQPESVWSYDLGLKVSRGRWQAEAFAWYADYHDKIGSRLTGQVTPEGRLVVRSENLGEARLLGLEAQVRCRVQPDLQLYAVLNYTWGEESTPDGSYPADRIPPLNGRIGLLWETYERWRVEPYIDFAARQDRLTPRDVQDPRINPQGTSGWTTVNLLLSWHITAKAAVGLKLQNLGDRRYREHGSGIDAPGRNLGFWIDVGF